MSLIALQAGIYAAVALNISSKKERRADAPVILMLPLILLTAVSACVSISSSAQSPVLSGIATAFIIIVYIVRFSEPAERDMLSLAVICGGWLLAILFLSVSYISSANTNAAIVLGNSNILAQHLILLIPMSIWLSLAAQDSRIRLFHAVAAFTFVWALILTKSFSAISCLVIAFAAYYLMRRNKKTLPANWRLPGKSAAILIMIAILIIIFTALIKLSNDPASLTDRLKWFHSSIFIFLDNWMFGAFTKGGFAELYQLYKGELFAKTGTTLTHNLPLQILADHGIAGVFLIIWMIFCALRLNPGSGLFKNPWWLITCLANALFWINDSSLIFIPNLLVFTAITAIAHSQSCNTKKTSGEPPKTAQHAHTRAGIAILFGALVILAYMNIKILFGYSFITAAKFHDKTCSHYLKRALRWDPANAFLWTELSMNTHDYSRNKTLAAVAQTQALKILPHNKILLRNLQIIRQKSKITHRSHDAGQ
ncbi:O-antigen ligase family protein [Elusimicrobiota bacterium]